MAYQDVEGCRVIQELMAMMDQMVLPDQREREGQKDQMACQETQAYQQ